MNDYNPVMLDNSKYGLLGQYAESLEELMNGEIPIVFENKADMLRAALPYFPEDEHPEIEEILDAGMTQIKYLRAKQIVDGTKDDEENRLKIIGIFLKEHE
ncbi:MAG: hypothetical protein KKB09_00540 [Nanoarchaeota archaeon]|nr:hypothetical protein [Nanoarchaeota archaeon]MBU4451522.1 hypothetical protein [Nanoarchaeota archaeon]